MSSHHGPYEPLKIKAQLDHAVIDSDGHYTEFMPVLADRFIELAGDLAGSAMRDKLAAAPDMRSWLMLSLIHI